MLPLWARVDLGAMAMKGCSALPKAPALLEPHHQIDCLVSLVGRGAVLPPLQRFSQCIHQPQPTGQDLTVVNATYSWHASFWRTTAPRSM